jgi:hypothetical protein
MFRRKKKILDPALASSVETKKRRKKNPNNQENEESTDYFGGGSIGFDDDSVVVPMGRKTLATSSFGKNQDNFLKRKKITRRQPGSKPTTKYFTQATQDSIVKWQQTSNVMAKEIIYVKDILPAFDALVENLINVYGFKVMYESKQDLKNECLEFLYSAVPKFDHTKGSKAFSYFNVVAKHWLTIKSKQNAKKTKQYISLDYQEAISVTDMETIEKYNFIPGYDEVITQEEIKQFLVNIITELDSRTKTENEKAVVDAIKQIMERIEDIDLLSKRAVLLYVRGITKLSSKQLSITLSSLKKHYKDIRKMEEFISA